MATARDADASSHPSRDLTSQPSQATAPTSHSNHLKQKRARSQLSCTPCRVGKLKCNREKPACDQCIKRSRESSCLYVPPPVRQRPVQNVKGRIKQLENLVVDLMNQNRNAPQQPQARQSSSEDTAQKGRTRSVQSNTVGPYSEPTPPNDNDTSPQFSDRGGETGDGTTTSAGQDADADQATTPFGQMKISKDEISYVGETHWNAILNSISDLKRDLGDDDSNDGEEGEHDSTHQPQRHLLWDRSGPTENVHGWTMGSVQPYATTGLGFMLGNHAPATKEELIASVPEKRVADRLLSLWFNSPGRLILMSPGNNNYLSNVRICQTDLSRNRPFQTHHPRPNLPRRV